MKNGIYQTIYKSIFNEKRDVALINVHGSNIEGYVEKILAEKTCVQVDAQAIITYWEKEFRQRTKNTRFVIDAAIIDALSKSDLGFRICDEKEIVVSNIDSYLGTEPPVWFNTCDTLVVVFHGMDQLDKKLGKIVFDRLKTLNDESNNSPTSRLKFLVYGAVDFHYLYNTSDLSPATNFRKFYPVDFLLNHDESITFVKAIVGAARLDHSTLQLIVNWSNGNTLYLKELSNWVIDLSNNVLEMTTQTIARELQHCVVEQHKIELFNHCNSAWDYILQLKTSNEPQFTEILYTLSIVISSGRLQQTNEITQTLFQLGLIVKDFKQLCYYPTNTVVEVFLRNKLSNLGVLLPISESTIWCIPNINLEAYELLLEIENRLRTFIGDVLFKTHKAKWRDLIGQDMKNKTNERMESSKLSPYFDPDLTDNFFMNLDFPELLSIVQNNETLFRKGEKPTQFFNEFDSFMAQANHLRRSVAHNKPVTYESVNSLRKRWQILRNLMRNLLDR